MKKNQALYTLSFLLLFLSSLISCKNIKAYSDQKIDYKSSKEPFTIRNNQMLITAKINQTIDTFIFDTGASSTIIFNEKLINEGGFISNFKIGAKLPDQSKIYFQEKKYSIDNNLISSENIVLKTLNIPDRPCSEAQIKDIFGNSVFKKNEKILNLDFEKSTIGVLNEGQYDSMVNDNRYFEIPIKVSGGVYLIIEEGKYKGEYLIDSGNSGSALITNNAGLIDKESSEIYEGTVLFQANGNIKSNNNTFINTLNDFPLLDSISMNVIYLEKFDGNNLGLEFIKRFNWVIDFKNNKAFIKIIDSKDSEKLVLPFSYLCIMEGDKLKICTKNISASSYNVGDEIVSIGNELISSANICEKMHFLNQSKNWEELDITVKR